MKLFVTDPCLVVPNEQWDAFNDNLNWNTGVELKEPFITTDGKTVVEIESTANGDGGCVIDGIEFGTDTGTLAIVQVPDDFVPEANIGAFADNLDEAKALLFSACAAI